MTDFPRVRWLALIFAAIYLAVFLTNDLSFFRVIEHAVAAVAGLLTALMAASRMLEEALRVPFDGKIEEIEGDAPEDTFVHTMQRETQRDPGFWGRVL